MVQWFNRRERLATPGLDCKQRAVPSKDLGLIARVNRRSRGDAPSPQFAYEHYREHIDPGGNLLEQLLNRMVNVFVVRNSLSHSVREDLEGHAFVWIRASLLGGSLANVEDLCV
eukprot:1352765-Pyramimonas_sp.AAC.1